MLIRDILEPTQGNQEETLFEDSQPDEPEPTEQEEAPQPSASDENKETSNEDTGTTQEDILTEDPTEIIEYNKKILVSSPMDLEDIVALYHWEP